MAWFFCRLFSGEPGSRPQRWPQLTFRDPAVIAALDTYTLLKVDMTANTEEHQAILKALRVFGPPTMLFYDENGVEQRPHRLVGHIDAADMVAHLAQLR